MQNKWIASTVLLILVTVSLVPITATQGASGNFWMWFSPSITPAGSTIEVLFNWLLALCCLIFVIVTGAMIYFCVAYREGVREETPNTHGHLGIEITWTIIPTIIMIVLGVYTFDVYSKVVTPPDDPLDVKVTGLQFAWRFEYPDSDIELNNQMILPTNRSIKFHIQSKDVLHSFYVPEFRMKQDAVPGLETQLTLERITDEGQYTIKCAELCGVGHYRMLSDLTVIGPEEFDKWKSLPSQDQRADYLEKVVNDE